MLGRRYSDTFGDVLRFRLGALERVYHIHGGTGATTAADIEHGEFQRSLKSLRAVLVGDIGSPRNFSHLRRFEDAIFYKMAAKRVTGRGTVSLLTKI